MNVARLSPSGKYIAACNSGSKIVTLYTVDPISLEYSQNSTGEYHLRGINDLAWSPCESYVATASEDSTIIVWRLNKFEGSTEIYLEPRRVLRGHFSSVTCLKFNYKGTLIVSGSTDEQVILWNVKGGSVHKIYNAHAQPIAAVDFSYDSEMVLSASFDGFVRIWSVIDGMAVRTLSGVEQVTPVTFARFSPNSVYVFITYTDGQTRLVDSFERKVVKKYGAPTNAPTEPNFIRELNFAEPNFLLIGSSSGVNVYDIKSQELIKTIDVGPTMFIDINKTQNMILCVGPRGIELQRLSAYLLDDNAHIKNGL